MNLPISQACSKLVGKSYKDYNCWDLIKKIYEDVFNLNVHHYYGCDIPDKESREKIIRSNKGEFYKVQRPEPGDIVLLKILGIECHIGMFIGRGRFIHSLETTGVVIDHISRYSTRVSGFYRHRSFFQ